MIPRCSIAVIILNWRSPDLAERCVESVLHSEAASFLLNIILIDNASGDGSIERLRAKFGSKVEFIESAENKGYAGGMNIGLARSKEIGADYALLLNADVELRDNTIRELVVAAEGHPEGAFFGPRIYDVGKPEDRWFVGGRWDWWQGTIRIVRERASDGLSTAARRIDFVNGAAMFMRLLALERIGVFDERFGLYFEESDLCSRASGAGYTLWHVPLASVLHVCGASTSGRAAAGEIDLGMYYRTRNRLLWGRKNLRGLRAISFWTNALVRLPIKCLTTALRGKTRESRGVASGIRDFLAGNFGMRQSSIRRE